MSWRKNKRKDYVGLNTGFIASKEQLKWFKYCDSKGIIIAPIPASKDFYPESWHVGVSFKNDIHKIYKTPNTYEKENIWQETFNTMKFYYNKKNE